MINPKVYKDSSKFRTANIRVSGTNIIHKANEKLGLKEGDVVTYTKEDILNILNEWLSSRYFSYYMIEHNEDEDNIHFHIVMEFPEDSTPDFKTLKNLFPFGLIDNCKRSVKKAVQYLIHMNNSEKYQYSWDDVYTNDNAKLEKYKTSTSADDILLKKIIVKIITGQIREYELDKIEPMFYIKHKRKIDIAFGYRRNLIMNNPTRNVSVFAIIGPPRIGKSTFVKALAEKLDKSVCFSSGSNDPWQDYRGQDIFVLDDFNYENTKIEDFLKFLDPHNNTSASSRYHNKTFLGDTIIMISNTSMVEWYTDEADVLRDALYKRIEYALVFDKELNDTGDGIARYQICKIEETGGYSRLYDKYGNDIGSYKRYKYNPINETVYEFNLNEYLENKPNDSKRREELFNTITAL